MGGDRLGVRTLLQGSVRRAGDRIRISAQLLDATTGYYIWSESYDREFRDIFSVQDEIADAIVAALKVSLGTTTRAGHPPARLSPTADMRAYELYLQGRFHWKRRGDTAVRRSIELFQAAIERDPGYAQAHYALAAAALVLPFYSREPPGPAFALAESAARQALALDPSIGGAHAVLAHIHFLRWNWSAAEAEFQRAFAATRNDPTTHQWYSEFLGKVGHAEGSRAAAQKAHELDPVSPVINDRLGIAYLWAGDNERAAEQFRVASELGFDRSTLDAAYVLLLLRQRRFAEAAAVYKRILGQLGVADGWVGAAVEAIEDPTQLADALGAISQARAQDGLPAPIVFAVAVLLEQPDLAFETAEQMVAERTLPVELLFAQEARALRKDPKFASLLVRIGLVEYWNRHGWPALCKQQTNTLACE